MQIGIVGLPFSGKSTLFQTMTRTYIDEATLARTQTNIATVKVPDSRVDTLAEYFSPKKLVYASVEFVDVIGLTKGDHGTTQFSNAFLGGVKTNDALIHVVRMFDDEIHPHLEGSIDPVRDIDILETEFILSDLAMCENRIEKLRKQVLKLPDDKSKFELRVLEKCHRTLEEGIPLRSIDLDNHEMLAVKGYRFLSLKPLLVLLNLDEALLGEGEMLQKRFEEQIRSRRMNIDVFSGKIEMELACMSDEEAAEFMKEYGLEESALKRIIRSAYRMLGLISFLTFSDEECRAWTIRGNTPAHEAAGAVHTDLMNRFIRAEVVHFDDFVKHGSIQACKEAGAWQLQGKEYVVRDGDMITVRHG